MKKLKLGMDSVVVDHLGVIKVSLWRDYTKMATYLSYNFFKSHC